MTNLNPFIRIIRKDSDPVSTASGDGAERGARTVTPRDENCTGGRSTLFSPSETGITMERGKHHYQEEIMAPTPTENGGIPACRPPGIAAVPPAPADGIGAEDRTAEASLGGASVILSHASGADGELSEPSSHETSVPQPKVTDAVARADTHLDFRREEGTPAGDEPPLADRMAGKSKSSQKAVPPIPAKWNFIRVARDDEGDRGESCDGDEKNDGDTAAPATEVNGHSLPQNRNGGSVADLSEFLHIGEEGGGAPLSITIRPSLSLSNVPFDISAPQDVHHPSPGPGEDTAVAPAMPVATNLPESAGYALSDIAGETKEEVVVRREPETPAEDMLAPNEGLFGRKAKMATKNKPPLPTGTTDTTSSGPDASLSPVPKKATEATSLVDLEETRKKKGKKGLFGRKGAKRAEEMEVGDDSLSSHPVSQSGIPSVATGIGEATPLADLKGENPGKPKKRRLGRKKNANTDDSQKEAGAPIDHSNGVPVPFNEKGTAVKVFEALLGRFGKKIETPEVETSEFVVVPTGDPRPVDNLRTVDITYEVDAPFQYVRVAYNAEERALRYMVIEPELSPTEARAYTVIEGAFQKLISTDTELISGSHREEYLKRQFSEIILILGIKLTDPQKERIYFHMASNYLGYSKLDTLMKDKYIEDVSCNGADLDLYVVHRMYGPVRTNVRFENLELNSFVLKLAQISGRHISLLQPIRDITLPDGSRGNLTLGGEVTKKGSTFTIRKFRANPISATELMGYGTIGTEQMAFLWLLMEYKRSLLVSGGTASGKTTLLNVLCSFIPIDYKIVSIEDTAELNLMHPNWLQSVTRQGFGSGGGSEPSGIGGGGGGGKSPGDISLYDLLIAALRQRPEFILVGEVRGPESFTLFQAIAVGHAAMGTIHAGTMDELISRVESNPMNVPRSLLCNLDAIIFPMQIKRGETSIRRVVSIVELLEMDRETGDLVTNTVFKWMPEDDTFRFSGKSYLFDKIRETFGVSIELLQQEVIDRAEVLQWMMDNGIREYHASLAYIRMYYRDKDELMTIVRGEQENAVSPASSE